MNANKEVSPPDLISPGHFVVGCNYWASHAGTAMWSDWRPEIVEEDLRQLAAAGLQVLRVFPLWPDFQPLTLLRGGSGEPVEFRHGEARLPEDAEGEAGVSALAMEHFAEFARLAEKYGLRLIAGLLTGWMSGRLFVPPALEGLNVLTDPRAIQWEVRLVRYFVRRFKNHPAIAAWDLGNECNCMAPVSREAAWVWTSAITNAIRVEDPSRPVVSGMHSLLPGREAAWTMQDQGELTDLLTTHPYPYFTPHTDQDPLNSIRTLLHSTAESRFYADIGSKPCLVEEIGTLGPMVASEPIAADFVRSVLFSLWAHDCHGLLWWCAFDQLGLAHAPYDWAAFERELGLVRGDRSEKPVLGEIGHFGRFLASLPFTVLPPRITEAVCILTEGQDQWGAAYSSFVLAKQAGFDLEFQYAGQPLKAARLYLLPSLSGGGSLPRHRWLELLEQARAGATLYVSHQDCMLSPFNEPFGLQVQTRRRRSAPVSMRMDGLAGCPSFAMQAPFRLELASAGARVLGRESDGNPVFTSAAYGQGQVCFLGVPIETYLAGMPGAFDAAAAQPFWQIYRHLATAVTGRRAVTKALPQIGLTEHPLDDRRRVVVAINYSPHAQQATLSLAEGWHLAETLHGPEPASGPASLRAAFPANDAIVFTIRQAGALRK